MKKRKKPSKNNQNMQPKILHLNAEGKVLGRLATETANLLRGKGKTCFNYREICGNRVIIYNARKIKITARKLEEKIYYKNTGYLGNLKRRVLKEVFADNPQWVIKNAVSGMLPKNKLRKLWLKNLNIYQDKPEKIK